MFTKPSNLAQYDILLAEKQIPESEILILMRLSTAISVAPGTQLMHQGDPGSEVIIVLDGELAVARDGDAIATLSPGAVVGEQALLTNGPRNADVTALTDATVAVLTRAEFASVLDACPRLATFILTTAIERLSPER